MDRAQRTFVRIYLCESGAWLKSHEKKLNPLIIHHSIGPRSKFAFLYRYTVPGTVYLVQYTLNQHVSDSCETVALGCLKVENVSLPLAPIIAGIFLVKTSGTPKVYYRKDPNSKLWKKFNYLQTENCKLISNVNLDFFPPWLSSNLAKKFYRK